MSDSSVITNDETDPIYKRGVNTDFGRVKFALLNPELTYTVSQYQTACGATDIMMHTLERYFHEGGSLDFTDQLSFTLLREVMANAPVALEHPDDFDARANIMWCGSLSHNGLMATGNPTKGDWACHQIEHELSAEFDVAHGAGLAAIWGSWARYVLEVDPARFAKLGEGVFGESDPVPDHFYCCHVGDYEQQDYPGLRKLSVSGNGCDRGDCRFRRQTGAFGYVLRVYDQCDQTLQYRGPD